MARLLEIPREDWETYLNALGRKFLDQSVHVSVENRELGDQAMARSLPLRDISFEKKGSELGDVDVTVGNERGDELGHRADRVTRVCVEENDAGEVTTLVLDEHGGGRTRIHFEEPRAMERRPSEERPARA